MARAEEASCKIQAVGEAAARSALHQAITQACAAAGIVPRQLAAICIGVSGASDAAVAARLRSFAGELTPAPVQVVGDNVIALQAALGSGAGVVLIAGTGSIAYGRNERGNEARAGGYGPAVSDEGSGTWIGKRAVREVLAQSGDSLLRSRILAAWKCSNHAELVSAANRDPAPDFAGLFAIVAAAAERDQDATAITVLRLAAAELASLAVEVANQLELAASRFRVGLVGGVFKHSQIVRTHFARQLAATFSQAEVAEAVSDPAEGALELARRMISP
ncbi:MAG TPA: BadF/BadG/BcrA/BcrD ATPase family protein [Terriglobales bacterium]|nr:BadF/BadG/BcrA/BcrD ATPase family protein [Terriglobales bacterium]